MKVIELNVYYTDPDRIEATLVNVSHTVIMNKFCSEEEYAKNKQHLTRINEIKSSILMSNGKMILVTEDLETIKLRIRNCAGSSLKSFLYMVDGKEIFVTQSLDEIAEKMLDYI